MNLYILDQQPTIQLISRFTMAYVTKILNSYVVDADSGRRVLMEPNLLEVKKNNKFGMHLLLQEMGITIIREISGKEPRKNSRLSFDKDAEYMH